MWGCISREFLYAIGVKWLSAKIDCYNYYICYVSLLITTKKIHVEDTQKEKEKESKHITTKKKSMKLTKKTAREEEGNQEL